jgi:hypothetical protein
MVKLLGFGRDLFQILATECGGHRCGVLRISMSVFSGDSDRPWLREMRYRVPVKM